MRRRGWNLAWLAGIVTVAMLLVVLAAMPLLRGDASGTQGSLVGKPAPSVESLPELLRAADSTEQAR